MRTYYKLVSGDEVVDAICAEDANWIVENPTNYSLYSGPESLAWGIESTDATTTWHIWGKPVFHKFPDYETVTLVEVEESDYEEIIAEIIAGRIPEKMIDPEEVPSGPEDNAKTKIAALEEKIAQLLEENEMLVECILEMSEIVYG